jgi:hypothetical protein
MKFEYDPQYIDQEEKEITGDGYKDMGWTKGSANY